MKNLNFKQIAIGIVGLIAIVMGLMKSPTTENETVQQIENQESIHFKSQILYVASPFYDSFSIDRLMVRRSK